MNYSALLKYPIVLPLIFSNLRTLFMNIALTEPLLKENKEEFEVLFFVSTKQDSVILSRHYKFQASLPIKKLKEQLLLSKEEDHRQLDFFLHITCLCTLSPSNSWWQTEAVPLGRLSPPFILFQSIYFRNKTVWAGLLTSYLLCNLNPYSWGKWILHFEAGFTLKTTWSWRSSQPDDKIEYIVLVKN